MDGLFSRRDLFKLAAGIAVGGTAMNSDLDKLLAAEAVDPRHPNRPWWIKDVAKPTMEIDWANMQRYDEFNSTRGSFATYVGTARSEELTALQAANIKKNILEKKPGFGLRDYAMNDSWNNGSLSKSFLGPQKASTPAQDAVCRAGQARPKKPQR